MSPGHGDAAQLAPLIGGSRHFVQDGVDALGLVGLLDEDGVAVGVAACQGLALILGH